MFTKNLFYLKKSQEIAPIDKDKADDTSEVSINSPLPVIFLLFNAANIPIAVFNPVV